jgi:hypothetical protein
VKVTATEGECGAGSDGSSEFLFTLFEGDAADGADVLFTSKGCKALIEFSNITKDWTLAFERISTD